jgi:hypothetical protein
MVTRQKTSIVTPQVYHGRSRARGDDHGLKLMDVGGIVV